MSSITTIPQRRYGPLSTEAAEQGIAALKENAQRLARDAKILLQARRYASAALLATIALVEFSRISALLALPSARPDGERRHAWDRFNDGVPEFPWSICHGGTPAMNDVQTNEMLSFVGAIGERVEHVEPGIWLQPSKIIGRPMASALVELALTFCANPVDPAPLRVWMDVVASCPDDADEDELFRRFRTALRAQGLEQVAAQLPGE
jgi:hypothetical protein